MKNTTYLMIIILFLFPLFLPNSAEALTMAAKPEVLLMQYIGGGSSDIISSQDPSKYAVTGSDVHLPSVYAKAYNKESGVIDEYFSGNVLLNDFFQIDAKVVSWTSLKTETHIDIYQNSSSVSPLQEILFHTSLSQPINLGDQYGAMQIAGWIDINGNGTSPPLENPVPEPTTMLLFGAGLVGLAGFGRKKFKK